MAHAQEAHSESTRLYWIVAGTLAVVTIVEVLVTFLGLDHAILVAILMVLSVAKGAAVVMFFMHLRGDARVFKFLFVAPFFIAVSMILLFLVLFSGHNGLAG